MDAAMIEARLREQADPARAEQERRYLKSELEHIGVRVPEIRRIARAALREDAVDAHDDVVALARGLWARPVHECRMAAVEVLEARSAVLGADDLALLEELLREARGWALVDNLSGNVAGAIVEADPAGTAATLDRWAADADFWLRRSALLALLRALRAGGGDFARFSRYADAMLDEREFFIRKAIGWVLRDTGKRRPELVFDWLLPRAARASGVTLREALKPLDEQQRAAIAAARG